MTHATWDERVEALADDLQQGHAPRLAQAVFEDLYRIIDDEVVGCTPASGAHWADIVRQRNRSLFHIGRAAAMAVAASHLEAIEAQDAEDQAVREAGL